MIKYFDNFKNPVYVAAECLRPANAMSTEYRNPEIDVMEQLLDVCGHLVNNDLDIDDIRH